MTRGILVGACIVALVGCANLDIQEPTTGTETVEATLTSDDGVEFVVSVTYDSADMTAVEAQAVAENIEITQEDGVSVAGSDTEMLTLEDITIEVGDPHWEGVEYVFDMVVRPAQHRVYDDVDIDLYKWNWVDVGQVTHWCL